MPPFLAMTSLHVFEAPGQTSPTITNDSEGTPGPKPIGPAQYVFIIYIQFKELSDERMDE